MRLFKFTVTYCRYIKAETKYRTHRTSTNMKVSYLWLVAAVFGDTGYTKLINPSFRQTIKKFRFM